MSDAFVWDEQPKTIQEILSSAFLPQVVKVCKDGEDSPLTPNQNILVLVREVVGSRILARISMADPAKPPEENQDKRLALIPAEYGGWFTFTNTQNSDQVDALRSISKVLEVMPHVFLTCAQIKCYYELTKPENGADYTKGSISGNEVLTVNSMYEGYIKYANHRGKAKRKLERFLQVTTSNGQLALVPIKEQGLFFIVDLGKNRHTDSYDAASVRRVKDILATNDLPLTVYPLTDRFEVKLDKKAKRPPPTTVELLEKVPFRAAVACSLAVKGNQLLELPLHTTAKFYRALQTPAPRHHEALRKTLLFADSHVDKFLAEIKFKQDTDST